MLISKSEATAVSDRFRQTASKLREESDSLIRTARRWEELWGISEPCKYCGRRDDCSH